MYEGREPVTIFADYKLNRFIFAPAFMKEKLASTMADHIFDIPSAFPSFLPACLPAYLPV